MWSVSCVQFAFYFRKREHKNSFLLQKILIFSVVVGMCVATTVTVAKPLEEKLVPAAAVVEDLSTAETNGRQFGHGGRATVYFFFQFFFCNIKKTAIFFFIKKIFWVLTGYGHYPAFGFGGILPISFYMLSSLIIIILYSEIFSLNYH